MNPLVSIITPITQDRRRFLPALLEMIDIQDYNQIEHILVWDEGNVGYKRNLGCERANGEIIIHFDSDDQYSSEWISRSVEFLISSKADITGLSSAYFLRPPDELRKYEWNGVKRKYVCGATMCYHKSFWKEHPFRELVKGEDTQFCNTGNVIAHNYIDGFMAIIHESNTSSHDVFSKMSLVKR